MSSEEGDVPVGGEGGHQGPMLRQGHHQIVSYLLLDIRDRLAILLNTRERVETRDPCSGRDTTRYSAISSLDIRDWLAILLDTRERVETRHPCSGRDTTR